MRKRRFRHQMETKRMEHKWVYAPGQRPPDGMQMCKFCGYMRTEIIEAKTCLGAVRIALRKTPELVERKNNGT